MTCNTKFDEQWGSDHEEMWSMEEESRGHNCLTLASGSWWEFGGSVGRSHSAWEFGLRIWSRKLPDYQAAFSGSSTTHSSQPHKDHPGFPRPPSAGPRQAPPDERPAWAPRSRSARVPQTHSRLTKPPPTSHPFRMSSTIVPQPNRLRIWQQSINKS